MRVVMIAALVGLALLGPASAKQKNSGFDQAVWDVFQTAYADACAFDGDYMAPPEDRMRAYDMTFTWEWAEDTTETINIYQIRCFLGAYNEVSVFLVRNRSDGLIPLSFAQPRLDIERPDDDEARVSSIEISGFIATTMLVNAEVDIHARTITSFSMWRGLGDASAVATYRLIDGQFALERYEVDATYDGEHNSEVILDYN